MDIKVLGTTYKIKEVELINNNPYQAGEVDYMQRIISIKKGMCNEAKTSYLMHEIMHSILHQLGLEELNENEQLIDQLATGILQVFKENDIVNWFEK